ncbi:hypothetical protein D3C85_1442620 [compost metagenome]
MDGRKAPFTVRAGDGYADPEYPLSVEWKATRDALEQAERRQKDPASLSRVLVVIGSSRNDGSCPNEISKSWRLARLAHGAHRSGPAGPQPPHFRIRSAYPPVQGLRLHGHAPVPLALQLLPQPRPGPDQ